jgi:hypothetical protein
VEQAAGAQLKIYGSGISASMRERWGLLSSVSVVGFVDQVEDAYRTSALMVCPVLTGGGTNIKVVEAASLGRVCVLTEAATRGFREYPELRDLLQYGEDASGMASVIVELLQSSAKNKDLAESHRDAFQQLFSLQKFQEVVKLGLDESQRAFATDK